jgi:hypothetical protein
MSLEEENQVKGQLLLQYVDAKKSLEILKEKARYLSKEFDGLGVMLNSDNIWNLSLESYESLLSEKTYAEIAKLKDDLRRANLEFADLQERAGKLGITL